MTLVCSSQMFAMQQNDKPTWKLIDDGYFSVDKSKVRFTATGSDHRLEQGNRKLKVIRDRKGFTNSQKALEKYFLTAGEMNKIITKVSETFKIDVEKKKRDEHYEIFGAAGAALHQP